MFTQQFLLSYPKSQMTCIKTVPCLLKMASSIDLMSPHEDRRHLYTDKLTFWVYMTIKPVWHKTKTTGYITSIYHISSKATCVKPAILVNGSTCLCGVISVAQHHLRPLHTQLPMLVGWLLSPRDHINHLAQPVIWCNLHTLIPVLTNICFKLLLQYL